MVLLLNCFIAELFYCLPSEALAQEGFIANVLITAY